MRIIVHTGKGGVGKTSISAATALRCADLGLRTIVISTDTAHSLADSLDMKIGPEPIPVTENLWAQEVDARYSMDKYWGRIQNYALDVLNTRGVQDIVAEEVTILPGLEEGAHLLWINKYAEEGQFDVLIVDAAPTAETLRLLSLPDTSRWWFQRIMGLMRGAGRVLRPLSKPLIGANLPDTDTLDSIDGLFNTLDKVRKLLADPAHSSLRLVINPERMVIKETQRTYTYLNLYGYSVDAVLLNRVIPDEVSDPYFARRKAQQRENIDFIGEAFGQLPMLQAPMFGEEVGGFESLRRLADALYGDRNPAEVLSTEQTHWIESDGKSGYYLIVALPFVEKSDLDLYRSADELTLRVGPYRRNIVLPYALWNLEIENARFEQSRLRVHFIRPDGDSAAH
ncbi:MAG TPA: ArsA family ATPase [Aggregatilinea sp.]|jgi:arsenite-transporting ATPase|uniref:ArsA family ATPase n=1 Tax=Aggregatilinea sp. TaxID=2806333 RepID=UPI002C884B95|nr:ArsA family ATPase [Aggregatilinea sp.]HML24226.1 ArsA family ATPase [Aggregatilinea sp.]